MGSDRERGETHQRVGEQLASSPLLRALSHSTQGTLQVVGLPIRHTHPVSNLFQGKAHLTQNWLEVVEHDHTFRWIQMAILTTFTDYLPLTTGMTTLKPDDHH